jgi:TRAP transporter TAXI family solute receptor
MELRHATEPTTLTAAAGGAGGSWYVLLEGLATLVHEIQPGIVIKVVEGGGVENHARVGAGELPMAILNPPMTVAALAGAPPYTRAFPDLRVGLTNLTVNHLQLVVDRAVPVASLEDWVGRAYPLRIPVDRVGTVDRMVFELALAHIGLSMERLEAWGGRAVPADNYHEQIALYRAGEVDALWQFMGIPSPSIEEAHAIRPVKILPLPAALIEKLSGLGWQASRVPVGAYGVVDQPVSTVAMGTSLGFHMNVPAPLGPRHHESDLRPRGGGARHSPRRTGLRARARSPGCRRASSPGRRALLPRRRLPRERVSLAGRREPGPRPCAGQT